LNPYNTNTDATDATDAKRAPHKTSFSTVKSGCLNLMA